MRNNGVYKRGPFTFIECPPDVCGAFPRAYELIYKCGTDYEYVIQAWDNGWKEDDELKEFVNWIQYVKRVM